MEWRFTIRQRVEEQVRCIPAQGLWASDCTRFINRHNKPLIESFFPEKVIEELDTGHWSKPIPFAYLLLLILCIVHAEM